MRKSPEKLNDAHAHLDMFSEEELGNALTNAKKSGVNFIVTCSTSFASNQKTLELAKKYPQILPAAGIYPLDVLELNELEIDKAFYFFESEIKNIAAIGEVGLDFKYSTKDEEKEKQCKAFARFIELSKKHDKTIVIHSRFAQRQVIEMLEKHSAKKVLLHSFSDSAKLMKRAAQNGYYCSVGLNVLHNEEVAKNILEYPPSNLLFETDSPARFNNEKSGPKDVLLVAKKVAEIKKLPIEEIIKIQSKNFEKLFL